MLELLCPLSPPLINESHTILPLLDLICAIPSFSPSRYDLNQHESWRTFDREKTHVDALSQRVQLLRVQGDDPRHLAMISLGKHGETPTLIAQFPACPLPELHRMLLAHAPLLPMQWLIITSPAWRLALPSPLSPPRSPLMAFPAGDEPSWSSHAHPHFTRTTADGVAIWALSDDFAVEDDAHTQAIINLP